MMQPVAAHANSVSYVNWIGELEPGTVTGTLFTGANQITVTYTGDVTFFNSGDTPTNYGAPASDYTAGGTILPPPGNGMIGLSVDGVDTLTFSQAVTDPDFGRPQLGPGAAPPLTLSVVRLPSSSARELTNGVVVERVFQFPVIPYLDKKDLARFNSTEPSPRSAGRLGIKSTGMASLLELPRL